VNRFQRYKMNRAIKKLDRAIDESIAEALKMGLITMEREENGERFYKITPKGQAMRIQLEKEEADANDDTTKR
jgi:hypothetical protein